jgi:hypothetical protein
MVAGTGLSKTEYLRMILLPDAKVMRSGTSATACSPNVSSSSLFVCVGPCSVHMAKRA